MIEPPRLLEDNPTDLERELLTAGASYRSSSAARQKTLAALGLVGTAAASASVAAASSSLLPKWSLFKLLTVSSIGVAVLTPVGFIAWKRLDAPAALPLPSIAPVAVQSPPAPRAASPEPAVLSEPEEAPAAEVPGPKADTHPAASGALSAELGVLDTARGRLASSDARGALGVLDDYAKTYPRGRLGIEAEVLRIDALAQSGDGQAAKKRAAAFLKRNPKSVLAPRVRRYLDEPR